MNKMCKAVSVAMSKGWHALTEAINRISGIGKQWFAGSRGLPHPLLILDPSDDYIDVPAYIQHDIGLRFSDKLSQVDITLTPSTALQMIEFPEQQQRPTGCIAELQVLCEGKLRCQAYLTMRLARRRGTMTVCWQLVPKDSCTSQEE